MTTSASRPSSLLLGDKMEKTTERDIVQMGVYCEKHGKLVQLIWTGHHLLARCCWEELSPARQTTELDWGMLHLPVYGDKNDE